MSESEMIEALAHFERSDGALVSRRFGVPAVVAADLGYSEKRMNAACLVVALVVHRVMPPDCAFLAVVFRDVPGFGPKLFQEAQSGKWREKTIGHLAKLKEPEVEAEFRQKGI